MSDAIERLRLSIGSLFDDYKMQRRYADDRLENVNSASDSAALREWLSAEIEAQDVLCCLADAVQILAATGVLEGSAQVPTINTLGLKRLNGWAKVAGA